MSMIAIDDRLSAHVIAVTWGKKLYEVDFVAHAYFQLSELGEHTTDKNSSLSDSKFTEPVDIVRVSEDAFAVSDSLNDCVRLVNWTSQYVSQLLGKAMLSAITCK